MLKPNKNFFTHKDGQLSSQNAAALKTGQNSVKVQDILDNVRSSLWVFGYGSLIWNPGFDYEEKHITHLYGLHRQLCIYSHHHRGTPQKPGLVMGLVPGGACKGMAFKVPKNSMEKAVMYLLEREMVTGVYCPAWVKFRIAGEVKSALTFKVRRNHIQYAGPLSFERMQECVLQGRGKSGTCLEYVLNTHRHLEEMGIRDKTLARLASLC